MKVSESHFILSGSDPNISKTVFPWLLPGMLFKKIMKMIFEPLLSKYYEFGFSITFPKFLSNLCMYINISSVVEFQRWWVLKSKLFVQESTCHQGKIFKKILRVMTVCQKVPKSYFQSQFWMSKIIWIFWRESITFKGGKNISEWLIMNRF